MLAVGHFRDGVQHGRGLLLCDGTSISGRWHDGVLSGRVTVTFEDGASLECVASRLHVTR